MDMIDTPYVERYADGQVIITEGIISTKAYIVLSGGVRISKKVGAKNIIVGTLQQGDVFGEMGLIQNGARSATVTAVGDVNVGVIDKEHFGRLVAQAPEDLRIIIKALVERLKITTDRLANIGLQWEQAKRTLNAFSIRETDEETRA